MRIRIFSDLHLEVSDYVPAPCPEPVDFVVLAGDIHVGTKGMDWARKHFPTESILYVAGNHEFYHGDLWETLEDLELRARQLGILLLENRTINLPEVRFIGTTLWTDFRLFVRSGSTISETKQQIRDAMWAAEAEMSDFRVIRNQGKALTAATTRRLHWEGRQYLKRQLDEPFAGKTVVISHHAPTYWSVPSRFKSKLLSAGFASNLDELMKKANIWIHGHAHEARDFRIGQCRVLCNPRGYAGAFIVESTEFKESLIIDVDD